MQPVQRIPRYILLLENFLKKLEGNSTQRREIEEAKESVASAADHSNNTIKEKVCNNFFCFASFVRTNQSFYFRFTKPTQSTFFGFCLQVFRQVWPRQR